MFTVTLILFIKEFSCAKHFHRERQLQYNSSQNKTSLTNQASISDMELIKTLEYCKMIRIGNDHWKMRQKQRQRMHDGLTIRGIQRKKDLCMKYILISTGNVQRIINKTIWIDKKNPRHEECWQLSIQTDSHHYILNLIQNSHSMITNEDYAT